LSISSFRYFPPSRPVRSGRVTAFYEKVKKVKADVAAVLV
jgi:hypothetical protein